MLYREKETKAAIAFADEAGWDINAVARAFNSGCGTAQQLGFSVQRLAQVVEQFRQVRKLGYPYVHFLCFGNGALTALHDKSDGFFRRQIVLTTKDRPAGRTDDPFLVDKLLRQKEGIFLWCLEGLHRLISNNYQFSISGKARENMETVKRSSNNVIEFLQSEGYIRFRADSEARSKVLYEAYQRWCEDNAQKPMSANRLSSELAQNDRLYNVEATNNVHVSGKRVRGFMGIEVVNPLLY